MTHIYTRHMSESGYLGIFHGPMFAGKTTLAVNVATDRSQYNTVLFINYAGDDRVTEGGEHGKYTSHNPSNVKLCDKVTVVRAMALVDVDVSEYQVLVIDESHMYPDLYDQVKLWKSLKKHIYVFGLDGDYRRRPIGQILDLIPLANTTKKLLAQCSFCVDDLRRLGYEGVVDHCPAAFSVRLRPTEAILQVGGKETYAAVCDRHYEELTSETR